MNKSMTIGEYLIEQLSRHGVSHVFGIPGDYALSFFDLMTKSDKLDIINTCDEQGAGFAADAYARIKGLGAVCITYGVGGLKVANTTAQAFAEKSPVIVISGAPGVKEQEKNPLLHHKVKDFNTQKKVFDEFTVASTILDDPATAFYEIDRVIHCALRYKRPVYIEIPRDMVSVPGVRDYQHSRSGDISDPHALQEALTEAVQIINSAERPVILAGVEVHRFGLQRELVAFAEKTQIPVATTILAKSVIPDNKSFSLGIYEGATGLKEITEYVESSDCIIFLGAFLTDLNTGIYTANVDTARSIYATSEKLTIYHHRYDNILFKDFLNGLSDGDIKKRTETHPVPAPPPPFHPLKGHQKMKVQRLFHNLNSFITKDNIIIADVGDALFGANDLYIHQDTNFLSPAYYASLGFSVPAAVGAHYANPALRAIVLIGDGAFQMTGMELSTIARYGLNPIVIVLNNEGYGTERPMLDGPFNDILPWKYSLIPEILGRGKGFYVDNEKDFDSALREARDYTEDFSLIEVKIDRDDRSPALNRLTSYLAKEVK
ncbi:MAG: alpha-keto acid decarboxylase family protein [Proteobacteria bacterium]|nr:alpha-keto acid decarboxylase family protein [Pseudomonadota bacterium]MBU1455453.1 alpha-keto acid decarboxylase family protein [Pseudomonadota bacterium]